MVRCGALRGSRNCSRTDPTSSSNLAFDSGRQAESERLNWADHASAAGKANITDGNSATRPSACTAPTTGAATYNTNGQRTATTPATGTASSYSYNQTGELLTASTPSGSGSYIYDVSGLRTSKTVSGTTTDFTWGAVEVTDAAAEAADTASRTRAANGGAWPKRGQAPATSADTGNLPKQWRHAL